MAGTTQQAIIEAFLEILAERSMDKVTVIDITKRCGVNRNTFYYHFHDIYELLDLVFKEEIERLVAIPSDAHHSWEDSFCEGISWCMDNSAVIYNIYRSAGRDRLERYFIQAGRISAARYMQMKARGLAISQQNAEDITHTIAATITGIVVEWVNGGMQDDLRQFIYRLGVLTDACVDAMLETAKNL